MKKTLVLIALLGIVMVGLPLPTQAAPAPSLVPCGRTPPPDFTGSVAGTPYEQCNFHHLVATIVRLINYLIAVASLVAMYFVLLSGWNLITALGNPDKIKNAKAGISNAVVGFAMIVLAFVFVNLLVNGIFRPDRTVPEKQWWNIDCIVDPLDEGCPFAASIQDAGG